ncbi:hypothetical protein [Roseivirga misakiensis]|uniref:Uncharacterized protein n=1 Tax=Roseivirga misakiensis TaxID=1563681 RepID=A0A1E5T5Y8_9BACT|nr:hypothetical protein [Roseivirga misakiensis]OEK06717.1 hypothetical protein BFP71_03380 [Roseivirga misakiensis]
MKEQFNAKQRAIELFDEGWDNKTVANQLGLEESLSEVWYYEYNIEKGLGELQDDPELAKGLLDAIKEFNGLKREELDLFKREKEESELKEKRSLLITFKKLLTFLKNHSQGFKWQYGEVILYIKKLKTLLSRSEAICQHDSEVFQKLFIWNRIEGLIEHLEQLVLDKEEGDTIKLNFDENDVLYIEEALEINEFDQEIDEEQVEEESLDGILEEEFSPKKY